MLNKFTAKITSAVFAVIMIIFNTTAYAVQGTFSKFYVDSTGTVEVSGYFEDTAQRDTTILMTDIADIMTTDNPAEHIMYIDQQPMGNNNVFLYRFQLDEKWSNSPYVLKVNGGELIEMSGTLREIPSKIHNAANNALRVGNDIYDIGCPYYTPDNISASIERGGNKIYYKIGGLWFNMLDPLAVSTEYFKSENAVSEEEWDAWEIDTYYHY